MTTDKTKVAAKPFLRLVNPKLTNLKGLIWKTWQDLALIACLKSETENGTIYVSIPEDAGVKREEFFHDARQYMEEVAEICGMLSAIKDLASFLGIDPDEELSQEDPSGLYVVTTKDKTNGASIITLPSVIEELSKRFTRFYIIPSSRHEMIVVPMMIKDRSIERDLNELVREINIKESKATDWLVDHIYLCENGEISQINTPVGV